MKFLKILSWSFLLLQVVIAIVLLVDIESISHLYGAGRAQSEMIIIGPILGSVIVAGLSGITLIILLFMHFANKLYFDKNAILLLFVSLFSPIILSIIALSLL